MSDFSKLDALLHKTHIKVLLLLRHQGSKCVDPLSKIAHQMWRDHPFSQRDRKAGKTVGVGVGDDRRLAPLHELCKETYTINLCQKQLWRNLASVNLKLKK